MSSNDAARIRFNEACGLKIQHLIELQSMKTFPPNIIELLEVIFILLHPKEFPSWKKSFQLLADGSKFINRLKCFHHEIVTNQTLGRVAQFLVSPENSPEAMRSNSSSAFKLRNWLEAAYQYHKRVIDSNGPIADALDLRNACEEEDDSTFALFTARLKFEEASEGLKRQDLGELQSMGAPPEGIKCLLGAVFILLHPDDSSPSWDKSQKMLADGSFMTRLKEFHNEVVGTDRLDCLALFLDSPENSQESVRAKSKSAVGLRNWLGAAYRYHKSKIEQNNVRCQVLPPPLEVGNDCEVKADPPLTVDIAQMKFEEACQGLKRQDFGELQSMGAPPVGIKYLLEEVFILLHPDDPLPSWSKCQKMVADGSFMTRLKEFHNEVVSTDRLDRVAHFLDCPDNSLEKVISVSLATVGLRNWLDAAYRHHKTAIDQGKTEPDVLPSPLPDASELGSACEEKDGPALTIDTAKVKFEEACKGLKRQELGELNSMGAPPEAIKSLLEEIFILLYPDDPLPSWLKSQKMLADGSFMNRLKEFRSEVVGMDRLDRITHFLDENSLGILKTKSLATVGLRNWLEAAYQYHKANIEQGNAGPQVLPPPLEVGNACEEKVEPPPTNDAAQMEFEEACQGLKRQDFSELHSMRAPPAGIKCLLEAVFVLLHPDDIFPSWDKSQKMLADGSFMTRLKEFDNEAVGMDMRDPIAHFLDRSTPASVGKSSLAAVGLRNWLGAVYHNCIWVF